MTVGVGVGVRVGVGVGVSVGVGVGVGVGVIVAVGVGVGVATSSAPVPKLAAAKPLSHDPFSNPARSSIKYGVPSGSDPVSFLILNSIRHTFSVFARIWHER